MGLVVNEDFADVAAINASTTGIWLKENHGEQITTGGPDGGTAIKFSEAGLATFDPEKTERVELALRWDPDSPNPINPILWGTEYWIGFAFRPVKIVSGFGSIMQFHGVAPSKDFAGSARANAFGMRYKEEGKLIIGTATRALDNSLVNRDDGAFTGLESVVVDIKHGEWNYGVLHFKLSENQDGYFETWINGEKVVGKYNTNSVYPTGEDASGNDAPKEPYDYFKAGFYSGDNATGEIDYALFKMWKQEDTDTRLGTYEDVLPFGPSKSKAIINRNKLISVTDSFKKNLEDLGIANLQELAEAVDKLNFGKREMVSIEQNYNVTAANERMTIDASVNNVDINITLPSLTSIVSGNQSVSFSFKRLPSDASGRIVTIFGAIDDQTSITIQAGGAINIVGDLVNGYQIMN